MTGPFRGLLLDVDDTLIDTRAAMVEGGVAAVAALWPEAGEQAHRAGGVHFHGDPHGFFAQFTTGAMTFEQMRAARLAAMVEELGLDPIEDVYARFEEAYAPAYARAVRVFDDVARCLEQLVQAGTVVGALTNSDAKATAHKLELTGLADAFVMVATTDDLGFGKPDPRAFDNACELLGVAAAQTIYVGDHLQVDAIAAKDAGLYGVWLRRAGNAELRHDSRRAEDEELARAHGIPVISSLTQVPSLFAASGSVQTAGAEPGGRVGPADLGSQRADR